PTERAAQPEATPPTSPAPAATAANEPPTAPPAAAAGANQDEDAGYATGARKSRGANVLGAIAKLKQMKG
ncbi:MAG: hypothetical protein ACON4Z_09245, partial [Planctomycetota bacterium]